MSRPAAWTLVPDEAAQVQHYLSRVQFHQGGGEIWRVLRRGQAEEDGKGFWGRRIQGNEHMGIWALLAMAVMGV